MYVHLPTRRTHWKVSESLAIHRVTELSPCALSFLLLQWFSYVGNSSTIPLWLKVGINTVFSLFTCYIQLSSSSISSVTQIPFRSSCSFVLLWPSLWPKRLSFPMGITIKFSDTGCSSFSFASLQSILYTLARAVF